MADDEFRVHLSGVEEARRKLAQLELFLEDLRPFWPLLVPLFIGWMGAQFTSEGGWGGQTWAPLSPAYAREQPFRWPPQERRRGAEHQGCICVKPAWGGASHRSGRATAESE